MLAKWGQWHRVDSLVLVGLLLTIFTTIVTYGGASSWVGHAVAGVFGLILMIVLMATGGMLAGRLRRPQNVQIFPLHKRISIWFSILVIGAFVLGLVVTAGHGEPLLTSLHGFVGLLVALCAAAQLVPSLMIQNRAPLRKAHRITGYLLAPLVTIQVIVGAYSAVIEIGKEIVLGHSLIGGISGLLFSWIIIEMRNPGPRSIYRAALAAYFGALLNITGCWIIGGYNYLTFYRETTRGIILSGSQPWAHQIVMEAKEHIFLFLPVISILLALALHAVARDTALASDVRVQKTVVMTAALALFLVILVFGMGMVISYAALSGQSGGS